MKKLYLLTILILIGLFAVGVASAFGGTCDSASGPCHVTTCAELQSIKADCDASDCAKTYVLDTNINCSGFDYGDGNGFYPIGDFSNNFVGNFSGQGNNITGLYINLPDQSEVGLFSYINGGIIKNVGLIDISLIGYRDVGGLVGYITSGSITDSFSTGSATGTSINRPDNVGGLVGYVQGGSINNSYSSAIISGRLFTGGLVGYVQGGSISNSYTTGAVSAVAYMAGGLVGQSAGTISNSYATGNVNCEGSYVGGLVGENMGAIDNSYATGNVNGGNMAGGLVGALFSGAITESYAQGNVNGGNMAGGLVGYIENGPLNNSYATGNVNGGGDYVGGLVGMFGGGPITNSYSIGNVSGGGGVGGLIGEFSTGSRVYNSYATGTVSGTLPLVGGLLGSRGGGSCSLVFISNSYWYDNAEDSATLCFGGIDYCPCNDNKINDTNGGIAYFYDSNNPPMYQIWDPSIWTFSGDDYPILYYQQQEAGPCDNDNVCDPGETYQNCPQDCPEQIAVPEFSQGGMLAVILIGVLGIGLLVYTKHNKKHK